MEKLLSQHYLCPVRFFG